MSLSDANAYWLGTTAWAGTRLRLQNELTQTNFDRHLLDPSIPISDSSMLIADVATGTGVWALDIASKHPDLKVEGLDINLDEVPPQTWLPENVSFRHFDLLKEVPENLVERYDIVHLQFVLVFVLDHNVDDVMRNLLRMLKPGGYLQWTDSNRNAYSWRTATPTQQPTEVLALYNLTAKIFGAHDPKNQWLNAHKELFLRHGLQDVKFLAPDPKPSTEQPMMMNWLWTMEEGLGYLRRRFPEKEAEIGEWYVQKGRALREIGELKVGMNMRGQRCVGRKPLG